MLKFGNKCKRLLASLLLAVILGGAFAPLSVSAETGLQAPSDKNRNIIPPKPSRTSPTHQSTSGSTGNSNLSVGDKLWKSQTLRGYYSQIVTEALVQYFEIIYEETKNNTDNNADADKKEYKRYQTIDQKPSGYPEDYYFMWDLNYMPFKLVELDFGEDEKFYEIIPSPNTNWLDKLRELSQFNNKYTWTDSDGISYTISDYNAWSGNLNNRSSTNTGEAWIQLIHRMNEFTSTPLSFPDFAEDTVNSILMDKFELASAGTDTITPSNIGYYLTVATLGLIDNDYMTTINGNIASTLHPTIDMGTVFEEMSKGNNGSNFVVPLTFSDIHKDNKGNPIPLGEDDSNPYSVKRLGLLALPFGRVDKPQLSDTNSRYIIISCIAEYWNFFIENGLKAYKPGTGSADSDYDDPSFYSLLTVAHDIDKAYGDLYPWIHEMYTWTSSEYTKSLEDIYDEMGGTGIHTTDAIYDLSKFTMDYIASYRGDGTPLDKFYSFTWNDAVITSLDMDAILNDTKPISIRDTLLQTMVKASKSKLFQNTGFESLEDYQASVMNEMTSFFGNLSTDLSLNNTQQSQAIQMEGTISQHAYDVYFSDYIVQGMVYSTTYIPMRTNVYDTNLISSYTPEFREEFFNKYGYLRKALLMDTSGSAAVNYYNSNGSAQGTLKLCTLRDVLYNDNGDDIVLYVDTGFYNADEVMSKAPSVLAQHTATYNQLEEDLLTLAEVYAAVHQEAEENDGLLNTIINGVSSLLFGSSGAYTQDYTDMSESDFWAASLESIKSRLKFTISSSKKYKTNINSVNALAADIQAALLINDYAPVDSALLKTGEYRQYDTDTMATLSTVPNSQYVDIDLSADDITNDNYDSLVLSSLSIKRYLESKVTYSDSYVDGDTKVDTQYETNTGYTPMMAFAFVSYLYRNPKHFTLANLVTNTPVFIASDDLVGTTLAETTDNNQWYRNSLLNYALIQNLKSNVQIDYTFCIDLDCPLYIDIFGNILTESGIVVIPAASNATLHTAYYSNYNVAFGLYNVYGKEYKIPISLENAYSVLYPFFTPNFESGYYDVANVTMQAGSSQINFAKLSNYSSDTSDAVQKIYNNAVKDYKGRTNLNYPAMVNIINEVLRGAYMENIDKDKEGLTYYGNGTYGALVAAAKYEGLLDSLSSSSLNSLLAIPDFTKMDGVDYWVSLAIKLMIVATVAVCIVSIYRDAVANVFGWHTFKTILSAVVLTVACITVIPNVFNLTYYAANKYLLEDEAFRILLINEEKRQCGVEIKMSSTTTPDMSNDDFTLRLESVNIPWYKQMRNVIYGDVEQPMNAVRDEAFNASPIISNNDITVQGDGVYMTTTTLFDSVGIDYLWQGNQYGQYGLYLWNTNSDQTLSYYSPYYAFLQILCANVNAYNNKAANGLPAYSYTSKYVSGNRLKTVGLCYNYFNSPEFLGEDSFKTDDIMQIRSIYYNAQLFINYDEYEDLSALTDEENYVRKIIDPEFKQLLAAVQNQQVVNMESRYSGVFSMDDLTAFGYCRWYNVKALPDLESRIKALDNYARDFVAKNQDLLTKVTDETFIKCMALYMSVKYNQLFGIDSANSLELYNLNSTDILRLSSQNAGDVALSVSMSYPRFVYNYGGEASVYVASFLSAILWLGSFIKPIATLLVFISVVVSIWLFRIVLDRPSANLWGYLITVLLLCATNFAHALILKLGLQLPKIGLPMIGCLVFMCVGQIVYLLVLSYVVGVALKDWSNLGFNEYQKEAMHIKSKFLREQDTTDHLSGNIAHHENNWDYYDDLVNEHRARNVT